MERARQSVRYWAAEHPTVSHFRWDGNAWGSSWMSLLGSVLGYLLGVGLTKLAVGVVKRKGAVPLGPVPAIHSVLHLVMCVVVFVGCWEASAVEMEQTRWIWSKCNTAAHWILCFPLGTRPVGRVFFWSYVFYLLKYAELLDTFICILQKKPLTFIHIFQRVTVVCACFLWLQFSQSLQIWGILTNTLVGAIKYWHTLGWGPGKTHSIESKCQIVEFGLTFAGYIGVLLLHLSRKEGCSGMGAWLFNAASNAALLSLFFNCQLKNQTRVSEGKQRIVTDPFKCH